MKKWFVMAVVCGGLYYYAAHTDSGKQQYVQIAKWLQQRTGQTVSDITSGDSKTTVYKIQNPDGSWTYSNVKPKDSTEIIEQEYRSDTNVLPPPSANPANSKDSD